VNFLQFIIHINKCI